MSEIQYQVWSNHAEQWIDCIVVDAGGHELLVEYEHGTDGKVEPARKMLDRSSNLLRTRVHFQVEIFSELDNKWYRCYTAHREGRGLLLFFKRDDGERCTKWVRLNSENLRVTRTVNNERLQLFETEDEHCVVSLSVHQAKRQEIDPAGRTHAETGACLGLIVGGVITICIGGCGFPAIPALFATFSAVGALVPENG